MTNGLWSPLGGAPWPSLWAKGDRKALEGNMLSGPEIYREKSGKSEFFRKSGVNGSFGWLDGVFTHFFCCCYCYQYMHKQPDTLKNSRTFSLPGLRRKVGQEHPCYWRVCCMYTSFLLYPVCCGAYLLLFCYFKNTYNREPTPIPLKNSRTSSLTRLRWKVGLSHPC